MSRGRKVRQMGGFIAWVALPPPVVNSTFKISKCPHETRVSQTLVLKSRCLRDGTFSNRNGDQIFFAILALFGPPRYKGREGNFEKVIVEPGRVFYADLFGGIRFRKKLENYAENLNWKFRIALISAFLKRALWKPVQFVGGPEHPPLRCFCP